MPVTINKVLNFIGVLTKCGAFCVTGSVPFAAHKFHAAQAVFPLFPPVGDAVPLLKPFVSVMTVASGLLSLYQNRRLSKNTKFIRGLYAASACLLMYAVFVLGYVRSLEFKQTKTYSYYVAGLIQTNWARGNPDIQSRTKQQAMEYVGTDAIELVWEPWSIEVVEFFLFISYLGTLCAVNYAFGAVKVKLPDFG